MPCDDWRPDCNVLVYNNILNEICTLSISVGAEFICIGGDFNTDLKRTTYQTNSLKSFLNDNELHCCAQSDISDVQYTYESKINGKRSLIDHFIISGNLNSMLTEFTSLESINNTSDHIAVKCMFNYRVDYDDVLPSKIVKNHHVWNVAQDYDIALYMKLLDEYLINIPLPLELINCQDNMCNSHKEAIESFHDNIVNALVMACENSIPTANPKSKSKVVIGWNEYVEHHFRTSLFWHNLWVDNGRPDDGIIANIRKTTRELYHKVRKNVIKHKGLIQSSNLANSLKGEPSEQFWAKVKKQRPNSSKLPSSVDGIQDHKGIAGHFMDKFESLYNIVGYDEIEMNVLKNYITDNVNKNLIMNDSSNNLLINPDSIRKSNSKLKLGKMMEVSL